MSSFSDLRVLYNLTFRPVRGKNHADRLESFYGNQADAYDSFRKRFLTGREELWHKIGVTQDAVWADMGGGTGFNLQFFGDDIAKLKKVYVVDLASSLLKMADDKIKNNHWTNVETVNADATIWEPAEGLVDVVTFSYSLTMIPDWFTAIDHAYKILKPGGKIGVVDFYISRKFPTGCKKRHGWLTRSFWPAWFSCDNIYPSCDHVPYLSRKFQEVEFIEREDPIPYFPIFWWKMPRFVFIGKKPE
ncbi:MAG: class I SAM-dependent methyltransferase [Thermoguttaceae bacterium]|nr:class I SAM-dependent methyltransferase [Thermoguttaceae bacterium]